MGRTRRGLLDPGAELRPGGSPSHQSRQTGADGADGLWVLGHSQNPIGLLFLGPLIGGPEIAMSILRNAYVMSILRNPHIPLIREMSMSHVVIFLNPLSHISILKCPRHLVEFKVNHNTCSLHLVSNFQNSSKHTKPSIENSTSR